MPSHLINFDQAATSFPKAPPVAAAVHQFLAEQGLNVGRGDYQAATELAQTVYRCRRQLAALFGERDAKRLIFSSGVTMSLNQIALGLLRPGDTVITSSMEHNSVLRPLHRLAQRGLRLIIVPAESDGCLDPERVEEAYAKERRLGHKIRAGFFTAASNLTGSRQPLQEIGQISRRYDAFYIIDAAQALGSFSLAQSELRADAFCFPGHKGLLGPQGIGGMLLSERLAETLEPVIAGGTGSYSQELEMPERLPDRFEAGTLNLPGIVGLAAALDWLQENLESGEHRLESIYAHKIQLTAYFLERLQELELPIRILGPREAERQVGVVALDIRPQDAAELATWLDDFQILTRVGLHCAPLAHETVGTYPQGAIRFSFGYANTPAEIDQALDVMMRYFA